MEIEDKGSQATVATELLTTCLLTNLEHVYHEICSARGGFTLA
jgi:hypothetical protein